MAKIKFTSLSLAILLLLLKPPDECDAIIPAAEVLKMNVTDIEYSFSSNDFLIVSQPRSSSNLLVEMINNILKIPTASELFSKDHLGCCYPPLQHRQTSGVMYQPAEAAKAFKLIYKYGYWKANDQFIERNSSKLFGFKLFLEHLGQQNLTKVLSDYRLVTKEKLKVIYLHREAFFLGALSLLEAMHEQKWFYTGAPSPSTVINWTNVNMIHRLLGQACRRCVHQQLEIHDLNNAEQEGLIEFISISTEDFIDRQDLLLGKIHRFLTGRSRLLNRPRPKSFHVRGRSSLDLSIRIPNLRDIIPKMLKVLSELHPVNRALDSSNAFLNCRTRVQEEIQQILIT